MASLNKSLCMMLLLSICGSIYSQTRFHISGYVTASESGESLIGAVVSSGKNWVVTNEYGYYSLSVPSGDNTISFSYLGRNADDLFVTILKDTLLSVAMMPVESIAGAIVVSKTSTLSSAYMGGD